MEARDGYELIFFATLLLFFGGGFYMATRISRRTGVNPLWYLVGLKNPIGNMTFAESVALVTLIALSVAGLTVSVDFESIRASGAR